MKNIAIYSYKFMEIRVGSSQGSTAAMLKHTFSELEGGFSKHRMQQAINKVSVKSGNSANNGIHHGNGISPSNIHNTFLKVLDSIREFFKETFESIGDGVEDGNSNSDSVGISTSAESNIANAEDNHIDARNSVDEISVGESNPDKNLVKEEFKQEMARFMLSLQLSEFELNDLIKGGHANRKNEVSIYKSLDHSCEAFAVRSQNGRLEIRIRELEASNIVGEVPSPQSEILLSIKPEKFTQFINICRDVANECNERNISSVIEQNLSIVRSSLEHHDYKGAVGKCQALAGLYKQRNEYQKSAEISQLAGKMFEKLGKYELSAEQYKLSGKMYELRGKYELSAEQHKQSGKMYELSGKYELSAEEYQNAAASYLLSNSIYSYENCLATYCNMIDVYVESKEYEKAGQITIKVSSELNWLNLIEDSGVFFAKTIEMFDTAIEKHSEDYKLNPEKTTEDLILKMSLVRDSLNKSLEDAVSGKLLARDDNSQFNPYKIIIEKEGEQPNNPIEKPQQQQEIITPNLNISVDFAEVNSGTSSSNQNDSLGQLLSTELSNNGADIEHLAAPCGSSPDDLVINHLSNDNPHVNVEDKAYTDLVNRLAELCNDAARLSAANEGSHPYSNDAAALELQEFIGRLLSRSTSIEVVFDVMFKIANDLNLKEFDPQNTLFKPSLAIILNECKNLDIASLENLHAKYLSLGSDISSLNGGQIQILQLVVEIFVNNCDKWINDNKILNKFLSFIESFVKDGQCANKVRQFMKLYELSKSSLQSTDFIKNKSEVYPTPNQQQIARQSARRTCLALLGDIIKNLTIAKNSGLPFFVYEDPVWRGLIYDTAVKGIKLGLIPDGFAIGRVYRLSDKSIVQVDANRKLKLLISAEKGQNINKQMYTNEEFKKLAPNFDEIDLSAQGKVYDRAIEVLESVMSILNYVGAWGSMAVTLTELGNISNKLPVLLNLFDTMRGDVSVRYVLFNMLHVIAFLTSKESQFGITKLLSLDSRVICGGMGKPSLLIHPKFMEQINTLDKDGQKRNELTTKLLDLYMLPSDSYNFAENDGVHACKEQIKSELNSIKSTYDCLADISDADIDEFVNKIYNFNNRVWDTLMLDCERINHWLPRITNPVAWNDFSELLEVGVGQVRKDGVLIVNVNRVKVA